MSIQVKLAFGAMSPKISEQLDQSGYKYEEDEVKHFQNDADAITRLKVRGLMPESAFDKAYQKLTRNITIHVAKLNS